MDAVRKGLQMGAERPCTCADEQIAGSDVLGTATVLAAAVRHIAAQGPVDLVVTGMAALDGLTSVLPTLSPSCSTCPPCSWRARSTSTARP